MPQVGIRQSGPRQPRAEPLSACRIIPRFTAHSPPFPMLMYWILGLLLVLWSIALGVAGGLLIGSLCVDWYRISSFEGNSGYFVLGIGLAGGLTGLLAGIACLAWLAPAGTSAMWRAWLIDSAVLVLLAGSVLAGCRLLADLPPRIDGQVLLLEVELRLPAGSELPAAAELGLSLHSISGGRSRRSWDGRMQHAAARMEDGRWLLPGEVFLPTERGKRLLEYMLDGKSRRGFLVPLPARPGHAQLSWSDWLPRPPAGMPPWPDSETSYRFRLRPQPPHPAQDEQTPEQEPADSVE